MKLTFIHDGPLFYDNKGNYFEFAYHELYERYSYLADEIFFLMRTKPIEGSKKFTIVPNQVNVVSVPNFKKIRNYCIKRKEASVIVEKQVKNSDYLVLRLPSSIAQLALVYIKKYNKPYIVECVGCAWDSYWNYGLLGKFIAPFVFLQTRSAIRKSKYVYYVTNKFLQRRYPTNGKTVSCSNVVIEHMNKSILEKRLEKINLFDPKNKIILGTAAAIDTRYKGHEYVIRSIPELLKKGFNVEYQLAGGVTGQKRNTFLLDLAKSLHVEDRVIFCGSLSSQEMERYYDSLDIYIQPSKQEGLPRAVIEAMSRGCPVLGTNIAGIPELISNECLFEKGSSIEVIKAIERILKMNLCDIAIGNFNKAKEYEREKLISRRNEFYDMFLSDMRVYGN